MISNDCFDIFNREGIEYASGKLFIDVMRSSIKNKIIDKTEITTIFFDVLEILTLLILYHLQVLMIFINMIN